jgi:hypothetical protein
MLITYSRPFGFVVSQYRSPNMLIVMYHNLHPVPSGSCLCDIETVESVLTGAVRSHRTRESTPTQTHKGCSSSISSRSEYNGPITSPIHYSHIQNSSASAASTESYTPSRYSEVTNEDGAYREGVGPSPPHPFSAWDHYISDYRPEDFQNYSRVWSAEDVSRNNDATG